MDRRDYLINEEDLVQLVNLKTGRASKPKDEIKGATVDVAPLLVKVESG
ncbi:MAG TPA: hypothetical protein VF658_15460 [Pyrinomonadaceae bacterium]|jgi:hypothetical protein